MVFFFDEGGFCCDLYCIELFFKVFQFFFALEILSAGCGLAAKVFSIFLKLMAFMAEDFISDSGAFDGNVFKVIFSLIPPE